MLPWQYTAPPAFGRVRINNVTLPTPLAVSVPLLQAGLVPAGAVWLIGWDELDSDLAGFLQGLSGSQVVASVEGPGHRWLLPFTAAALLQATWPLAGGLGRPMLGTTVLGGPVRTTFGSTHTYDTTTGTLGTGVPLGGLVLGSGSGSGGAPLSSPPAAGTYGMPLLGTEVYGNAPTPSTPGGVTTIVTAAPSFSVQNAWLTLTMRQAMQLRFPHFPAPFP